MIDIASIARRLPEPVRRSIGRRVLPRPLPEGETVPEWMLQSWNGDWHRHNDGRWAVMVFYPSDECASCAEQLRDYQEHYPRLSELGAQVYGVNPAEAASHEALARRENLEFPLLTDRGGVVARQFRAAVQLPLRTVMLRTVYLVNPKRLVRLANRGAPPAEAVVRSIQALQQASRSGM